MNTNKEAAFTLMELLVVIAIIAVLAGILFPMFVRAKDSGLETAAINNLKQLGTATAMYMDENDNKFLPSTNYGVPTDRADRLWTNNLQALTKSAASFVAPGTNGQFADKWDIRSFATIGYNSSTAVDRSQGCADDLSDLTGCVAFKTVASLDKLDPTAIALFTVTPGGELEKRYLGYEFSPFNGQVNPVDPKLTPPLVSDRDLVKEIPAGVPAELIKPVYARYLATGSDDGQTPIVFADSHVKSYSAKQIMASNSKIVWRLR